MLSSQLRLPEGKLFSDRHGFIARDRIDKPLNPKALAKRLKDVATVEVVSYSDLGIGRSDGVAKSLRGDQSIYATVGADGRGAITLGAFTNGFIDLSRVEVFDREGDLVFRRDPRGTYSGYEWVLRP